MDGAMKTDKRELRAWRCGGRVGEGRERKEGESKNFAGDVIRLEAIQFVLTAVFRVITSNLHSTGAFNGDINESLIYTVSFRHEPGEFPLLSNAEESSRRFCAKISRGNVRFC